MNPILVDTNILVRLANTDDPMHRVASDAVFALHAAGRSLVVTPQVLIEFRSVATRPRTGNGLGLSLQDAGTEAARFEVMFPLLEDTSAIFPFWKELIEAAGVIGKQVHDARLIAVCQAHGVSHLLTFNDAHFRQFARVGVAIEVIHPLRV